MNAELTIDMWQMLEEAATTTNLNSVDLEKQNPAYIQKLDRLADAGYLDKRMDVQKTLVFGYLITELGEKALETYRSTHGIPQPPENIGAGEWALLNAIAKGEYNQVTGSQRPDGRLAQALNDFVEKGYAHVDVDVEPPRYTITEQGQQVLDDQHVRLNGKSP